MDYLSKLPNEILLDLFEYCRVLPLFLVCKKFNQVISNSPALMRKISLVISEKISSSTLVKSERSHQAAYFKFNYKITDDCLEILTEFSGIKSLELMRCIVPADVFLKMLKALPNLETMSIYTTYLKNKEHLKSFEAPRLTKLKRLNFRNSDEKFLDFLRNSSLKSLYIGYPAQYSTKILVDFLKLQRKLRTIEYLSVASVDDSLMNLIAQDMPNLEKLHIECDKLDMSLIGGLELSNSSVLSLNLYGDFSQAADINVVLNFFKNLKVLEIEMNNKLEPANILQLQQLTPKVASLFITHCSGDYFDSIQLRNLKQLKLTDASFSADEWSRLSTRNPSIEKIVIKDESITDEVFRIICLEFRNLKHLEMFYDPQRLTPEILDFVCDTNFPPNIRFLKITQRSAPTENFLALSDDHKRALNSNLGFRTIFN
jgi:F-box-like